MPMVLPPHPQPQKKTLTFIISIILHFLVHKAKGLYYLPNSPGARYAYCIWCTHKAKYFVLFGGQERSSNEVKLEDEF